jgi:hypothetical protein
VERLRDVADRLREDWLADVTSVREVARIQRSDATTYRDSLRAEQATHRSLRDRCTCGAAES